MVWRPGDKKQKVGGGFWGSFGGAGSREGAKDRGEAEAAVVGAPGRGQGRGGAGPGAGRGGAGRGGVLIRAHPLAPSSQSSSARLHVDRGSAVGACFWPSMSGV